MPGRRPTRHDEVPEADALDQAMPVSDGDRVAPDGADEEGFGANTLPPIGDLPAEVPEADALEQAIPASETDDDWRERHQ